MGGLATVLQEAQGIIFTHGLVTTDLNSANKWSDLEKNLPKQLQMCSIIQQNIFSFLVQTLYRANDTVYPPF